MVRVHCTVHARSPLRLFDTILVSRSLFTVRSLGSVRNIMRRARATVVVAGLLLGAAGCISALELDEDFQLADPFESFSDDNVTKPMDEVVVPALLESENAVPSPDGIPIQDFTKEHHTSSLPARLPYGGALVAVEAAALLVGGATIIVLALAKAKSRYTTTQYDYEDYSDPLLQSLLYSDMDYAAI